MCKDLIAIGALTIAMIVTLLYKRDAPAPQSPAPVSIALSATVAQPASELRYQYEIHAIWNIEFWGER